MGREGALECCGGTARGELLRGGGTGGRTDGDAR